MRVIWQRMKQVPASHVWMILGSLAFCGPLGLALGWWLARPPAIEVQSMYEEDAIAVRGGELEIEVTRRDNRACFVMVARWMTRPDPKDPSVPVWREMPETPHSPPGPTQYPAEGYPAKAVLGQMVKYRIMVPLPKNIEAGNWTYQAQGLPFCAGPFSMGPQYSKQFPVEVKEKME